MPRQPRRRSKKDWRSRIAVSPAVCFGKPRIKGTRIWVSLILDLLAGGSSYEEILHEYPHLKREDLLACLAYGAESARERFIPVSLETNP
jgi:uncharacterized protein (DUF433 family)